MDLQDLPENIRNKITILLPDHWIWIGAVSNENRVHKQSVVRFNGKMRKVNRITLHLATGFDLDSKLQANHKRDCNLELCCNPEHLYAGTQQENIADRNATGNNRYFLKTTCPKGHELSVSPTTGYRYCQTCKNERRDKWREKQKEKTE